ncbi:MAG: DUF2029 domain-containing protein [candidate division Zixibacteria bacterium]|nr:DUF2029 domain-containing protein [candidate division Zixibacteria bacterium]
MDKLHSKHIQTALIVVLILYALIPLIRFAEWDVMQWDFKTYYYAAKAYVQGMDPYNLDILTEVANEEIVHPYVYPPYTLSFFSLFTLFSYKIAYIIYAALKIIILSILLTLWWKYFLPDKKYSVILLFLCIFGFRLAIISDLHTGNVGVFEQFFIWLAVLYFLRKDTILFSILILLSAYFKLTYILLLALLFIDNRSRSLYAMIGAFLTFGAVQLSSYLGSPEMYSKFIINVIAIEERGFYNEASLPLIKDILNYLVGLSPSNIDIYAIPLYALYILAILTVTLISVRNLDFRQRRFDFVVLVFLLLAVLSPRFKGYNYIILIIPALYIIANVLVSWWSRILILGVVSVCFLPYQTFLGTLTLLGIFLWHLHRSLPVTMELEVMGA